MQFRGRVRGGRMGGGRMGGGRMGGGRMGGGRFMIVGSFDRIATETAHDHETTDAVTQGRP